MRRNRPGTESDMEYLLNTDLPCKNTMELVRQVELKYLYKAIDWKMRGWGKKTGDPVHPHHFR